MWKAVLGLLVSTVLTLHGQQVALEDMGSAVKRSLDRSRELYPDAALPDSPLSQAVLARITYLRENNPSVFSDPDWPLKITSAEAARLGIPAYQMNAAAAAANSGRYLAEVTKSFSQVGVSFRKGQEIVLEELRDYKKKGVVMVDGQEVVIWLDKVKILRPLARTESNLNVIKIESARYGPSDQAGYPVSDRIQAMVSAGGPPPQILVTDALIPPGAAQRFNRNLAPRQVQDPKTGQIVLVAPSKILTVTYVINGREKTKQAIEGQTMILD